MRNKRTQNGFFIYPYFYHPSVFAPALLKLI
nr:MAG TPA: hypothetical protein [Caudoviricetes sp.]